MDFAAPECHRHRGNAIWNPALATDLLGRERFRRNGSDGTLDGLMGLILDIRQSARANKDWGTSDKIRDGLKELSIVVKDGKDGTNWSKE